MFPRREPGRPWWLLALILALALVTAAAPALAQPPRAERPTYRVGDTWVRTDGTYTLTRIDGDVYVFVAPGEREIHLTKDLVVTKVAEQGAVRWQIDRAPAIRWPLATGTSGFETSIVSDRSGSAKVTATWSVEAFERVTVQAGSFDAFRVVLRFIRLESLSTTSGMVLQSDLSLWYAPAAGGIVKMTHTLPQLTAELAATTTVAKGPAPAAAPLAAKPAPAIRVAISSPADQARVTEEDVVLAGVVSSERGVSGVVVTLNGVEVARGEEPQPRSSVAVNARLKLRTGPNTLLVTATAADGSSWQEVRTVFHEPAGLAAVPDPATAAPEAWAVVIGVGRHDSRDIPTLGYTVSDAEAIYDALVTVGGFKKDNVLLLTDRSERQPTLRNIKWALGTFLARSAGRQDTVVIYFAGHGAPEVDQRGLERDGLAKYLIPRDADAEDLYSTALPMDELQTIFGRLESERVVAFLDACFSGAAGGRTFTSRRTRAARGVDDLFLERLTRAKGRAIVTASRTAEVALELPELGHGVFTYYLIQALRGAADANRDGVVTLQELYEYVAQQVSRKARSVGGRQNPMLKGELEGVLPLVRVGGR